MRDLMRGMVQRGMQHSEALLQCSKAFQEKMGELCMRAVFERDQRAALLAWRASAELARSLQGRRPRPACALWSCGVVGRRALETQELKLTSSSLTTWSYPDVKRLTPPRPGGDAVAR